MLNVYPNSFKTYDVKTDRPARRNREITVITSNFSTLGSVRVQPEEQNLQKVCLCQADEKSIVQLWWVQSKCNLMCVQTQPMLLFTGGISSFPGEASAQPLRSSDQVSQAHPESSPLLKVQLLRVCNHICKISSEQHPDERLTERLETVPQQSRHGWMHHSPLPQQLSV